MARGKHTRSRLIDIPTKMTICNTIMDHAVVTVLGTLLGYVPVATTAGFRYSMMAFDRELVLISNFIVSASNFVGNDGNFFKDHYLFTLKEKVWNKNHHTLRVLYEVNSYGDSIIQVVLFFNLPGADYAVGEEQVFSFKNFETASPTFPYNVNGSISIRFKNRNAFVLNN